MLVSYLCREAAELEAWISEKEAVAASEDIGRDLEHVEVCVYIYMYMHALSDKIHISVYILLYFS